MTTSLSIEHVSKSYRLGVIGGGTLHGDLTRWWARVRHKADPLVPVDRLSATTAGNGSVWALTDVSFMVEEGEAVGIIGRNGAGKSTILKILSRVTAPTSGVVRVRGRVGSLLEVGTGFHPELTGRENIFLNGSILGMQRKEIQARLDDIIEFADVQLYVDTPVKRYSSGMYVRLAFAVAAHLLPEILLVDEVLAVGDTAFQQKCLKKMKEVANEGRTVLFVSHNMMSVRELCSRAVLLSDGTVELDGAVDDAIRAYLPTAEASSRVDLRTLEPRGGSGRARVVSLAFANQFGQPTSAFHIGDDIHVDITIEATEPIRDAWLDMHIHTSGGVMVTNLSPHRDSGFEMGVIDGTVAIRAVLRDQRFYPGTYSVGFYFAAAREALDSVESAASFEVSPGGPHVARPLRRGIVHLIADWSRES